MFKSQPEDALHTFTSIYFKILSESPEDFTHGQHELAGVTMRFQTPTHHSTLPTLKSLVDEYQKADMEDVMATKPKRHI